MLKTILCAYLFLLSIPALAGFERHFGEYSVVSFSEYSSCGFTDAVISRKVIDGYPTVLFEAVANRVVEGGECSSRYTGGMSVHGMPGITCSEGMDHIRCTSGRDVYQVTASSSADGTLAIKVTSYRPQPATSEWVLRRK